MKRVLGGHGSLSGGSEDRGWAASRSINAATAVRLDRALSTVVPWLPVVVIGLATLTVLWTRLIGLDQSMWDDELYSVVHYITPGPSGIFGSHYAPNDHALFELLTWMTVQVTGFRSNATFRFWGVVPAIAAIAVMTWWLRIRRGTWVAAAFAVLAVSSPVHLTYGVQARGYGLAFLAAVLLVIGAVTFKERRSRHALVLVVIGSLMGIWTLPVFVLLVLAVLSPLLWFRELRRPLLITLVAIGLVSLLFYAPMLSGIISNSGQQYGRQLGWNGFLYGPLDDQVVPGLQLLLPHAPVRTLELMAAAFLAAGGVGLWRQRERVTVVTFLGAPIITYVALEVGRFYIEPRFASFVLLPMLAMTAIGLAEVRSVASRIRGGRLVTSFVAVFLSVLLLSKVEKQAAFDARVPQENTEQAAMLLSSTGFREPIVTNSRRPLGFSYYLGSSRDYRVLRPSALATMFCSTPTAFIYVEHGLHSPLANTACLQDRHAVRVTIPQQDSLLAIWFVPTEPSHPSP